MNALQKTIETRRKQNMKQWKRISMFVGFPLISLAGLGTYVLLNDSEHSSPKLHDLYTHFRKLFQLKDGVASRFTSQHKPEDGDTLSNLKDGTEIIGDDGNVYVVRRMNWVESWLYNRPEKKQEQARQREAYFYKLERYQMEQEAKRNATFPPRN
jgi:hypothetical protein